jgi:hypothetical protein
LPFGHGVDVDDGIGSTAANMFLSSVELGVGALDRVT